MKIAEPHIAAIQSFGYTEDEARFLYIVATHSGYFLPRQFITFTGTDWGKRSNKFGHKIESHGYAGWREYQGTGRVYHLFSKTLYGEIGKENLRNRRRHSTEFIRTRLVLLDFIIENQQYDYLETEQHKVQYFCDRLGLPKHRSFVAEFLVDLNATKAAIRAGYSAKSAHVHSARLLADARISAAIAEGQKRRLDKLGITAERVLSEIALLA
jgi:hypothetical protein